MHTRILGNGYITTPGHLNPPCLPVQHPLTQSLSIPPLYTLYPLNIYRAICSDHEHKRANAAYLITAFCVAVLGWSAERSYTAFLGACSMPCLSQCMRLSLLNCRSCFFVRAPPPPATHTHTPYHHNTHTHAERCVSPIYPIS